MTSKDDRPAIPLWLLALAAVAMLGSLYLTFVWVSTEATMGIIQRIFYFHVPAAAVAFWAVFVGGVASLLYVKTGHARYDDLALSANESVVLFEAINITMGSIWAKRVWGIWWTWDARLTSAFLLFLIYAGYLIARNAAPRDQRATICAVISIIGMVDVPFVYLSTRIFRTQHPSPVIGGGPDSGLAPDMAWTLAAGVVAMLLLWWCILRLRRRVERAERQCEALIRAVHEFT